MLKFSRPLRVAGPACAAPAASGRGRQLRVLFVVCTLLGAVGCRQDMQDQPKMKPYRSSTFFRDGLSSRPLVPGTVPRGYLKADSQLFTGKKNMTTSTSTPAPAASPGSAAPSATPASDYPDDVDQFPFPINAATLNRGQERYNIFCSVCHGMTGEADGLIVRRGYRKPPSFHIDRLRRAPVGHFFDVATNGWGVMPGYATQIPVQDRWAIIAYIRALQLSREAAPAAQPQAGTTPLASPTATPRSGGQR
jgi:mono/diheme cytochrome c family protein